MPGEKSLISDAFRTFFEDAPNHQQAWFQGIQQLSSANVLDPKTSALAYLAVMAAVNLHSGIPYHVREAKNAGASRDEVISAILIGLPAIGNRVISALPAAVATFDAE
jgi:alkylhydroperoxidase/carboxymuconolactone decarboxylase family protein YurZ